MFHRHKHKWEEVLRGYYKTRDLYGMGDYAGVTLITYQCQCGRFKQVRLDGNIPGPRIKGIADIRVRDFVEAGQSYIDAVCGILPSREMDGLVGQGYHELLDSIQNLHGWWEAVRQEVYGEEVARNAKEKASGEVSGTRAN